MTDIPEFDLAIQSLPSGYTVSLRAAVGVDLPPQRRICVLLHDGYYGLAVVCDQVEMLVGPLRARYPVPSCMAKTHSLLEWLVVHEEAVSCVTTAARLAAYCQRPIDLEGPGNG